MQPVWSDLLIKQGIYTGTVWHERLTVTRHCFQYQMLMLAVDLDEIDQHIWPHNMIKHNQRAILSIRDRDHFPGSTLSLKENIAKLLPTTLHNQDYRVIMVTQLAHFGFAFNPISFFIVTNQDHRKILGTILEVHNTPWGERKFYPLFNLRFDDNKYQQSFQKSLHVSPFLGMDYEYHFSMTISQNNILQFDLENWQNNDKHFSAGITLQHDDLKQSVVRQKLFSHPFSPHKSVLAIYWQALKLMLKRVPLFSHPKRKQPPDDKSS